MRKRETTLGDVYGEMLKGVKTVVNENAQENINKSKKIPKMSKNAFNDKMDIQKGGPTEADGFHKALNDDYCGCDEEDNEEKQYDRISEIEKKLENPNLSDKEKASLEKTLKNMKKNMQREEAEENIVKESKKIARERLNTFMMKKSTFDKLFESVMGGSEDVENAALGLSDAPTDDEFGDDMGDDMGDEDMGDEVTFTLDRATAQKLHDVLMGVLGGEEDLDFDVEGDEMDEECDEMDEEGDMYDEEEYDFEEDEEAFPTDHVGNDGTIGAKNSKDGSHKFQSKNNKVGGRPQPKNQGTKVTGTTDKVGNDGDYGHALHGAKQPNYGKQNKVSDYRQGEDYFR